MASDIVLNIAYVDKSFSGLHALKDVNLQVEKGKTHAIIGPNGAGKSTLLNVCIGRLAPDRGTVTFNGEVITGKSAHEINQAGVVRVFQTPEIFHDLTVLENVMIPALARRDGSFKLNPFVRMDAETDILHESEQALKEMNLLEKKHMHAATMSRGDKRRLELAMGLVQHPLLFLLDEPTAGMSRADTNATIASLQHIKERGMTKVIIEHDMQVVFSLADKISVLAQGQIIAEGTPDEIRGNPRVQEAYLGGTHNE
ncbi:ABC transporter ATP-binding protein [Thiohalophilus sp.]|uniref:ABC transporter ATP-binding protein n=1 Tax=Thiohalophilus sp. TaxID=3028392 RepID=UPI002ACDAB29|nr:ABC transporter ATP-binding protein [Thiohalophilus sp.]MDZ7662731.1 ABC transporter ATP-binding protein [Thiohalophilus sp.]MDZ7804657.1 ABC transporter ATP-binding protein [Thiohalophilus sp.]